MSKIFNICKHFKEKFRRETRQQRVCDVCKEIKLIKDKKKIYKVTPYERLRRFILRRDFSRCKICQGTQKLSVHHWDRDKTHNVESNLVTLCHFCHMKIHVIYRRRGVE
jgi:hypothetical protein